MIELRQLSKSYNGHVALQPLDLKVESGTTVALIGPSGCGKSTLLRMILGLIQPTGGEVRIQGDQMTPQSALKLRRQIGYVIQDGGLFPHLTAAQNVLVMLRYLQTPEQESTQRLHELAELTHLDASLLTRFPNELSGGQRQRVGLMRALALNPNLLLLDEPLGALDPLVRAQLQTDLKEIFERRGQTVLLVTHDMGEAAYLAQRIVLLRNGQVVQDGAPLDFQQRPADAFVTEFLQAQRQVGALA